MIRINYGKKFELQFKKSVSDDIYYKRINDPPQSFSQASNLRFSPKNPYDCIMYSYPNFFTLEFKSTQGASITFYREDFVEEGKNKNFMILKHQIESLKESSLFEGVISGFILNFRKTAHTYFWDISDFIRCTDSLAKKSFNEEDVILFGGYLFEQTLKRVNYHYNIKKFVSDMKKGEMFNG